MKSCGCNATLEPASTSSIRAVSTRYRRATHWSGCAHPGNATLFTFAIVHAPPHPAFAQDVPYITAIVELEEGPKMPANIVGVDPDPANLEIGMPLKVVFTKVNEECTLPNFAPA